MLLGAVQLVMAGLGIALVTYFDSTCQGVLTDEALNILVAVVAASQVTENNCMRVVTNHFMSAIPGKGAVGVPACVPVRVRACMFYGSFIPAQQWLAHMSSCMCQRVAVLSVPSAAVLMLLFHSFVSLCYTVPFDDYLWRSS